MTEFQNMNYGARTNRSYQSARSYRRGVLQSGKIQQSSFSQKTTAYLKLGYIYGNVDLTTGQELYMNYDESSTQDDPVLLAEGIDIHGNAFQTRIHLNDIDVHHASIVEMAALNLHLTKRGDPSVNSHVSFPLETLSGKYDLNQKMNFEKYFSGETQKLQSAGYNTEAALYQEEFERYLFFQNTGRVQRKTEKEHVLFQNEEQKTGVFSNKTLAEAAGFNLDYDIDWDSDGTGTLTEEQIQYLKENMMSRT